MEIVEVHKVFVTVYIYIYIVKNGRLTSVTLLVRNDKIRSVAFDVPNLLRIVED